MNAKKEQNYYVLVYNNDNEVWEVKKQHLWYHEAKTISDEYEKKLFSTKVIDEAHIKDFLNVGTTS